MEIYSELTSSIIFRFLSIIFVLGLYMTIYVLLNFRVIGKTPGIMISPMDKKIPMIPYYAFFYTFTYVYLTFGVLWIIYDLPTADFEKAINCFLAITLSSGLVYVIYPIKTIRPKIPKHYKKSRWAKSVLQIYEYLDPYNLFPSMHTGFSVMTLLLAIQFKPELVILFYPLTIGIILSTVFIKQHYLPDLFAGFFLAEMIFQFYF